MSTATAVETATATAVETASTTAVEATTTAPTVAAASSSVNATHAAGVTANTAASAWRAVESGNSAIASRATEAITKAGAAIAVGRAEPRTASGIGSRTYAARCPISGTSAIEASAAIAVAAAPAVANTPVAPAPRVSIIAVIPGAGPNKHATEKPASPVISIGRASIRIEGVIAPPAYRGAAYIIGSGITDFWSDTDSNCNLSIRLRRHHQRQGKSQQ
jgi:hypothetical protein